MQPLAVYESYGGFARSCSSHFVRWGVGAHLIFYIRKYSSSGCWPIDHIVLRIAGTHDHGFG